MSATEEAVQSQAASPEDISALADQQADPDIIPAGATQATTTVAAQKEAQKFLDRVGRHDKEAEDLRKSIESNAEASRSALIRAQRLLMQHPELYFPSDTETAAGIAQALNTPNPGVGMAGAAAASSGRAMGVIAAQEEAKRQAMAHWAEMAAGVPLQTQLSAVEKTRQAALQKLLEMQEKGDTGMGRAALSMLGRQLAAPGNQAAMKPNSTFGKIALDALGPRAYNTPGDPTSGFSAQYRAMVGKLNDAAVAEAKARAGIDVTPETVEDKISNANAQGVPFAPVGLPDVSHMSTRERTQYYQKEEANASKQFDGYALEDQTAQAALRAIDEFQQINAHTHTGPELAPYVLSGAHVGPHGVGVDVSQEKGGLPLNPFAFFASFGTDVQRMNKLAAQIVSQAIPAKGFGRVTNRDLALFQQGSMGIDKNQGTNDDIAQALKITLNNWQERNKFYQAYFGRHRSLQGAEASWQDYLDHNPVFDPSWKSKKGERPPLNPNRTDWRTYFRAQNPQVAEEEEGQGPPGTQEPDVAYHPQPADTQPAMLPQGQARGGRVGYPEGGPVESQPDPEVSDALKALINGLTFKAAGMKEDPNDPGTNFFGELAGAGGTAALALAALRNKAAREWMMRNPNLTAAGASGVAGGLAGASQGQPLAGAAAGVTLSPLTGRAGRYGSEALLRLSDELTRSAGPGVRRSLNAVNADTGGDWEKVADRLLQDAKLGVPSTLAEAAGPRSVGLTSSALRKDTPEGSALLGELQARQAQSPIRTGEAVNAALKPDDYFARTQQLRDALYTKAAPLYDQAYKQFPSVKAPALQALMQTPDGQKAAMQAFQMMQNQRIPIGAADAVGMVQNPSLQYMDEVKRALDDMIIKEEGSGMNYQATNRGRVLRGMRSDLVKELDQATMGPQGQPSPYKAARDQYAGDLDIMDALRSGHDDFKTMTPEQVRQLMTKLDWSARDAYRTGVAEGILQQIGNQGGNRNSALSVIANPNVQEKIMAIFDSPKEGQRFIQALQRQAEVYQTGKTMVKAGETGLSVSQQPTSISQMLRAQLMRSGTAGEIADTMGTMANDPQAQEKIRRLRETAERLRTQKNLSTLGGAATAAGVAAAGTPSPMQVQ